MTLARFIASAPTDALALHCLQLSHPDWPSIIRRVSQPDDTTVMLETAAVVVFEGFEDEGNWLAPLGTLDDSGIVTRQLQISDVDNTLLALVESVRDSDDPITCVYRLYTSDDLDAPKIVGEYEVGDCSFEEGTMQMTVRTLDLANMRWPRDRHTDANTPGWRGRWQ